MTQKAQLAWELYLKMGTSSDSFSLLHVIANDCFKVPPLGVSDAVSDGGGEQFSSLMRNVHIFSSNLYSIYIWSTKSQDTIIKL